MLAIVSENKCELMSLIQKILILSLTTLFSLSFANNGEATWYAYPGKVRKTANGSVFNENAMTCAAHTKYKFGTKLKVTNLANGKHVVVTVTDRGEFMNYPNGHKNVDLTKGAFRQISDLRSGRIKVKVEVVE